LKKLNNCSAGGTDMPLCWIQIWENDFACPSPCGAAKAAREGCPGDNPFRRFFTGLTEIRGAVDGLFHKHAKGSFSTLLSNRGGRRAAAGAGE